MMRCLCYRVIIVLAASANSCRNWKWGPCYPSSGERPLVWQRNTLYWPIAYSPKRGWGTCTILGNLFHSSFAIEPSMQREPEARDSTMAAQLNCAALCCRFSSECIWLWGLRDDTFSTAMYSDLLVLLTIADISELIIGLYIKTLFHIVFLAQWAEKACAWTMSWRYEEEVVLPLLPNQVIDSIFYSWTP